MKLAGHCAQRQLLQVDSVTVTYRNGHTAIRDVDFQLTGGTLCALIGMNGGGKSTLFKSIMGTVRPTAGSITLDRQPIAKALRKNRIAYVPQTEEVDWHFPVLVSDVVMMGRYGRMSFLRIPSAEDKFQVEQAIKRVDLWDLRQRQIGELSGGQRKRVFLARALAQQGGVLLLDEPFTGIDMNTEHLLIGLLQALRDEGQLILVSTHQLGNIPDYCDHVVMINRSIQAAGPVAKTFTRQNVALAFGGAENTITRATPP